VISSKAANGYLSNFVRECVGDANLQLNPAWGDAAALRPAPGSSGRATSPSGSLAIQISTRASQVNLGKDSHGDQVLSCRSICWAFSLALARLARTACVRVRVVTTLGCRGVPGPSPKSARTHLSFHTTSPVPHAHLPWPGHESLTLAFCLATRRCMNLGPSFL
jgi:hypothetical protein